jgi:hypothetical protein
LRDPFFSLRSLAVAGFLAVAGLTVIDCGSAVEACDKRCDCEKCTTSARNACIATGESDAQDALKAGCTSELDDLHSCEVSTGVCMGTDFATSCDKQKEALKSCAEPKK